MDKFLKKPYEISLWEDVLVFIAEDDQGNQVEYSGAVPQDAVGQVVNQYYKERKICVIGSDTMNTPIRATKGKIVANINGSVTLDFEMFSQYYDEDLERFVDNPFIKLLVNERKVKVRYGAIGASDTIWYDLIIKNVQENSENNTFAYQAKSLFINELSKSGFNIELNVELENNTGTITQLAEYILAESDWKIRAEDGANDLLRELKEEPLYEVRLNRDLSVIDMLTGEENQLVTGTVAYMFYSDLTNQESYVQLLYVDEYEVDDDRVITNSPNYGYDGATYTDDKIDFVSYQKLTSDFRGKKLVRKAITKYDSTTDKYVSLYNNDGQIVYGYATTEYVSPTTVRSFVTNPAAYSNFSGWEVGANSQGEMPELNLTTVPDIRDVDYSYIINNSTDFVSCLKVDLTGAGQMIFNSGIVDHRQFIENFVQEEPYVFRLKVGQAGEVGEHGAASLVGANIGFDFLVAGYALSNGQYQIDESRIYFQGSIDASDSSVAPEYQYCIARCERSLAFSEMINMTSTLGLFILPKNYVAGTYYIEDFEFFKYVDNNGSPLLPNEINLGKVMTLYSYYVPNENYQSEEDVEYVYRDYEQAPYQPIYNDDTYEKIRSITASESNRFNLIQELCEIFECWPKFEIEHNEETGEILLDENYRQKKWITFHEYIGNDNYSGFKYGVNLKNIKRTIDSDSIVTKMIVKDNANEFATDGFCSIARAQDSPNGENFLLDFGYYVKQGMLGMAEIDNDLYLDTNGYIGYYKNLRRINRLRDDFIQQQSGLLQDIFEYESAYQTYSVLVMEGEEQLKDKTEYVKSLTGFTLQEMIQVRNEESELPEESAKKALDWWTSDKLIQTMAAIAYLKATIANYSILADTMKASLDSARDRYDFLTRALTSSEETDDPDEYRLLLEKESLNRKFYSKYSRFLQEGSWISEDYIDDNLYYLDSESTLHTSAQPKITYDISVLEISQLDGYENYNFALGDKTYMEDTEFFGWVWIDGIKTPYHEEIVVVELTTMLDSPEQNEIKVQNYKTQFEDLFQRIAATTQSIEYSTGEYSRVAGIVSSNGTININTLQNSVANNALTLQNAKDQSVLWDETGITTTSLRSPNEMVRIVSGGIFISNDGGLTWQTGITGNGINANYITSGQINTNSISILNGAFPSFRWDGSGINAYCFDMDYNSGNIGAFDYGKFVRFDQFGLYGLDGFSNFDATQKDEEDDYGEDKIWKNAKFALTWKGFSLKSDNNNGYISITSNNDFQVFSDGQQRIKIGKLYGANAYGMQLFDESGAVTLEQANDGKLWLKDSLTVGNIGHSVKIGNLSEVKLDTDVHEVVNANDKFVIYEDGSMKATDGEFTGIIYATGGRIGNLEIESLEATGFEVVIETDSGLIFKNGEGVKILTAKLYKLGVEVVSDNLEYQWSRFSQEIAGATSKTLEVRAIDLNQATDSAVYSCSISYAPAEE